MTTFFMPTWWVDWKKMQKKKFSRWPFFKIHFICFEMHMDGPDNLKKNLGHHINYLSIWPFMCHPWFPTGKASKLTFICFQHQVLNTLQGLDNWSWKQINVSFEAFLVGNQGWHIKGQITQLVGTLFFLIFTYSWGRSPRKFCHCGY